MKKIFNQLMHKYEIRNREVAAHMCVDQQIVQKYLGGIKKFTPYAAKKIYQALVEVAKERSIRAIEMRDELETLSQSQELLMDMSKRDSISDM